MNMEQRREKIVSLINREGSVSFTKLKENFHQVSEMTLRRDLEYLDRNKRIIRTHGGARSVEVLIGTDDLYLKRTTRNADEKKIIAEKAVSLVQENTTIFLDSGSTCTEFARHMPDGPYMIFTTSLSGALELARLQQAQVGGVLRRLFHDAAVEKPVGLGAFGMHRRPLAQVQRAGLQRHTVGGAAHFASQGIDFIHQMAFAGAPDGGVAGHVGQRIQIEGEKHGVHAHARAGQGRFHPRMPGAYDCYLCLFHVFLRQCRSRSYFSFIIQHPGFFCKGARHNSQMYNMHKN